jgi:hypothetical protein
MHDRIRVVLALDPSPTESTDLNGIHGSILRLAERFGLLALARQRRVKGVTSTRLPDLERNVLRSVATSL